MAHYKGYCIGSDEHLDAIRKREPTSCAWYEVRWFARTDRFPDKHLLAEGQYWDIASVLDQHERETGHRTAVYESIGERR